jgi:hypothetical protein
VLLVSYSVALVAHAVLVLVDPGFVWTRSDPPIDKKSLKPYIDAEFEPSRHIWWCSTCKLLVEGCDGHSIGACVGRKNQWALLVTWGASALLHATAFALFVFYTHDTAWRPAKGLATARATEILDPDVVCAIAMVILTLYVGGYALQQFWRLLWRVLLNRHSLTRRQTAGPRPEPPSWTRVVECFNESKDIVLSSTALNESRSSAV